jgi:hypothetical protein
MVWPDPIVGYRLFVDGVCRTVFENSAGQYVMTDDGERVYGVYLTAEVHSPWRALLASCE